MGWLITGIAINNDYKSDLNELFQKFNIDYFKYIKETSFNQEISNDLDEDIISIGFFGDGTFLLTPIDLMCNEENLKKVSIGNTLVAFYVSENTNTFCFDFYVNGNYIRKKWLSYSDQNIDSSENFGDILPAEINEDDDLGIVFKLISKVLGKDFYEIEENAKMFCYKIFSKDESSLKNKGKSFLNSLFKRK